MAAVQWLQVGLQSSLNVQFAASMWPGVCGKLEVGLTSTLVRSWPRGQGQRSTRTKSHTYFPRKLQGSTAAATTSVEHLPGTLRIVRAVTLPSVLGARGFISRTPLLVPPSARAPVTRQASPNGTPHFAIRGSMNAVDCKYSMRVATTMLSASAGGLKAFQVPPWGHQLF